MSELGTDTTVAFLGLGKMGHPMVGRLAEAGYPVLAFDVSAAAVEAAAEHPGVTGVSALDEVAEAGVVILMLPSSDVVEDVLINQRLLDALADGTYVIDMSSSEPARTQALAKVAAGHGVRLIDAPVSGGVTGAVKGSLTIMVGATEDELATVRPILATMGSRILRCGDVGAGHAVKALNNLMSAAHLLATSEAMLAAIDFGLDPAVVLDVINTSSGRSGSSENKWPNFVLTEAYNSGFGLRLMLKDTRIGLGIEQAAGTPSTLSALTVALWAQAADELPPDADHTEIASWLRQRKSAE